jgi:hypothetical protein
MKALSHQGTEMRKLTFTVPELVKQRLFYEQAITNGYNSEVINKKFQFAKQSAHLVSWEDEQDVQGIVKLLQLEELSEVDRREFVQTFILQMATEAAFDGEPWCQYSPVLVQDGDVLSFSVWVME